MHKKERMASLEIGGKKSVKLLEQGQVHKQGVNGHDYVGREWD